MEKLKKNITIINEKYKLYALLFSIILLIFAPYSLSHFPAGLFEDDTYFYYTITYNSLIKGFITFDGINTTNGFHPLWMFLLFICGLPLKFIGIYNPIIYGFIFNLFSVFIWYLIFLNLKNILVQFLAFSFALMSGFGMEGALAGLIMIQIFKSYFHEENKFKNWLFFPLVLTRIDLSITALILSLKKIKFKTFLEIKPFLIILLAIFSTFLLNFLLDGSIFSISSIIKSSEGNLHSPLINFLNNINQGIGNYIRYTFIFTICTILFYLIFLSKRLPNIFNRNLPNSYTTLYLCASSLSFLIFHTIFGDVRDWYFAPTGISLIFILDNFLNTREFQEKKFIIFIIVLLLSLMLTSSFGYLIKERKNSLLAKDFTNQVTNSIPINSRIYVFDGSGYLSWALLPNLNVVNGDGLVNSFNYYKMIKQRQVDLFLDYLKTNKIEYYITNGHFEHCLGNPWIHGKCDQFKNNDDIVTRIRDQNGVNIKIIGGEEIVRSKSKRKFMQYKLNKYPLSIFNIK